MSTIPNAEYFEKLGLEQPDVTVLLIRNETGLLNLVRNSESQIKNVNGDLLIQVGLSDEVTLDTALTNVVPSALDLLSDAFEEDEEETGEEESEDLEEDDDETVVEDSTVDDEPEDEEEDEEAVFDVDEDDDGIDAIAEFDAVASIGAFELSAQLLLEECNRDSKSTFPITITNVRKSEIILEPMDESSDHHTLYVLHIDTDSLTDVPQATIDRVAKLAVITYRDDACAKLISSLDPPIELLEYETYYQSTVPYLIHAYDANPAEPDNDDIIVPDNRNIVYHRAYDALKNGNRITGMPKEGEHTVESLYSVVASVALDEEVEKGNDEYESVALFIVGIAGLVHIDAIKTTTIEKDAGEEDLPAASFLFMAEYLEQHAGYHVGGVGKRAITETLDAYLTKYALELED